jgi:hypothetical protein
MKNCGGTSRLTSLYFASAASPTISIVSGPVAPSLPIRRPTTSRPRLNFLANASLTIATFGAASASRRVKSRPATSGIPSVEK